MNPIEYTVQIGLDGNMYCALIGENIQEGICGFGSTPAEALRELANELENV